MNEHVSTWKSPPLQSETAASAGPRDGGKMGIASGNSGKDCSSGPGVLTSAARSEARRSVAAILARDALAELVLDLAATAEAIADHAPRASLDRLEKAILALPHWLHSPSA